MVGYDSCTEYDLINYLSFSTGKENAIVVVEDITIDVPKTKTFIDILGNLKVADKKIMFIQPEYNDNVELSMRNVPYVLGMLLSDINTYDIVNSEVIVLTESAAKIFSEEEKAEA